MAANEPTAELDERFSSPGAEPRPWSQVVDQLEQSEIFWLSTVRRDGRPHVTPLPAMWLDGALHFCTGPGEQKAKNLESNPQCVLTTGGNAYRSGVDIVVEGRAVRVEDDGRLRRLAAMWQEKLDWPFDVVEGGFRDPDRAGADLAYVFVVEPTEGARLRQGRAVQPDPLPLLIPLG